jgi:hypothetical protein
MDPLQIGLMLDQQTSTHAIHSALPGAPVVPHVAKAVPRTRTVVASALHRLADAVSPAQPVARRRPVRTGAEAH